MNTTKPLTENELKGTAWEGSEFVADYEHRT